jgi:hypothetical protein
VISLDLDQAPTRTRTANNSKYRNIPLLQYLRRQQPLGRTGITPSVVYARLYLSTVRHARTVALPTTITKELRAHCAPRMHFHDFQRADAIHMLAGSIRFKNAGEVIRRIARLRRKAAVENGKKWQLQRSQSPPGDLYDTG